MVNVLFIYNNEMMYGGIEQFMMNYFRHMDSEKVHIDFAVQDEGRCLFEREIVGRGSKVYHLPGEGKCTKEFKAQLKEIFLSGDYQMIHTHCGTMNYHVLKLAEKYGIPVRISHSHTTDFVCSSTIEGLFNEYYRKHLAKYATDCWACSEDAGKWMYGKKNFEVIPNAIDFQRYQFDEKKRDGFRHWYHMSDEVIVLGHVGSLDVQKNQKFLIEVLKKLLETDPQYHLVLIGDGWMREEIEELIIEYGFVERVTLAGVVVNPEDYYQMMDLFLLPSLFEGDPLVLKEAEASGLSCIVSDKVSSSVDLTGNMKFCDLDVDAWCEQIKKADLKRRTDAIDKMTEKGYDIQSAALKLQERYIKLFEEKVNE